MKLQTVWTRIVVVIYLVTIIGVCPYVPTYETGRTNFAYRWVWKGNQFESSGSHSTSIGTYDSGTNTVRFHNIDDYQQFVSPLSIDYGRVALELVSLTATAGVLFLIGSFVGGKKWGKQPDPVKRV